MNILAYHQISFRCLFVEFPSVFAVSRVHCSHAKAATVQLLA
uniref:Uncharacterized protein n=1 Tax=Arundo donax TaxID=35708 RepID=A0A0A9A3F7_ARUDO